MPVDATKPTDGSLVSSWPAFIRENRDNINLLWASVLAGVVPGLTDITLGAGDNDIDVTGGLGFRLEMNAPPENLNDIDGGYSGQIIIIKIDETEGGTLNVIHNAAIINLARARDFPMVAGDLLFLINMDGVVATAAPGIWYEIGRYMDDTFIGLLTPNGTRVGLDVTNLLALEVFTL